MARGRSPNLPRQAARAAGHRYYTTQAPCFCGDDQCYVSNARCVTCSIQAGKLRYRGLDEVAREAQRLRDHQRYAAKRARAISSSST